MQQPGRFIQRLGLIMFLGLAAVRYLPATAQAADICAAAAHIPTAECRALVALYARLDGIRWNHAEGWLETANPCEWYGVECRAGHVSALLLRENGLSGTLPPAIGDLSALEVLELGNNAIFGQLPDAIGQLTQLRGLNLRNNRFSGALPDNLGNLRRLEWLYLSQNSFDGALPASLAALSDLKILYFRETEMCEPLQPDFQQWLAGISSLGRSEMPCDCGLITEIPATECKALFALHARTRGEHWLRKTGWLHTLTPCAWDNVQCTDGHVSALTLNANRLRGELPPELGHLSALTVLDVRDNALTGVIPPEVGKLTALRHLHLDHNALEGRLPDELGQLRNLTEFDVDNNRLEGPIPTALGNSRALTVLSLARNRFSGRLPATLGQLSALVVLDVSHNPFYGPLPHTLANLAQLHTLDLSHTYLRGRLPAALSRLPALRVVRVDQSQLCAPEQTAFHQWLPTITASGLTADGICPSPGTGFLPVLALVIAGFMFLLPGGYHACVSVFGEAVAPPERLRGYYYRKHGAPPEGLAIRMLLTGLFAFSCELLWGACAVFANAALGYGFGVGLMLYLGYTLVGQRVRRRTRITWIGRILGGLICIFLASLLLLTIDRPYASAQVLSIAAYMLLIMIPVWLMTSGVSAGGYWELMAEGLFLGSVWGVLAGGILGDALCAQAPLVYGGMSDILTYQVFSQTLSETTRRFLANELTGIFLFGLVGTGAGALTRSLQTPLSRLHWPIHAWMTRRLRPLLHALQKTA